MNKPSLRSCHSMNMGEFVLVLLYNQGVEFFPYRHNWGLPQSTPLLDIMLQEEKKEKAYFIFNEKKFSKNETEQKTYWSLNSLESFKFWRSFSTIILCCTVLRDSEFINALATTMTVDGEAALTWYRQEDESNNGISENRISNGTLLSNWKEVHWNA